MSFYILLYILIFSIFFMRIKKFYTFILSNFFLISLFTNTSSALAPQPFIKDQLSSKAINTNIFQVEKNDQEIDINKKSLKSKRILILLLFVDILSVISFAFCTFCIFNINLFVSSQFFYVSIFICITSMCAGFLLLFLFKNVLIKKDLRVKTLKFMGLKLTVKRRHLIFLIKAFTCLSCLGMTIFSFVSSSSFINFTLLKMWKETSIALSIFIFLFSLVMFLFFYKSSKNDFSKTSKDTPSKLSLHLPKNLASIDETLKNAEVLEKNLKSLQSYLLGDNASSIKIRRGDKKRLRSLQKEIQVPDLYREKDILVHVSEIYVALIGVLYIELPKIILSNQDMVEALIQIDNILSDHGNRVTVEGDRVVGLNVLSGLSSQEWNTLLENLKDFQKKAVLIQSFYSDQVLPPQYIYDLNFSIRSIEKLIRSMNFIQEIYRLKIKKTLEVFNALPRSLKQKVVSVNRVSCKKINTFYESLLVPEKEVSLGLLKMKTFFWKMGYFFRKSFAKKSPKYSIRYGRHTKIKDVYYTLEDLSHSIGEVKKSLTFSPSIIELSSKERAYLKKFQTDFDNEDILCASNYVCIYIDNLFNFLKTNDVFDKDIKDYFYSIKRTIDITKDNRPRRMYELSYDNFVMIFKKMKIFQRKLLVEKKFVSAVNKDRLNLIHEALADVDWILEHLTDLIQRLEKLSEISQKKSQDIFRIIKKFPERVHKKHKENIEFIENFILNGLDSYA
ncbi:hypothetical protein AB834_00555 [PVC group bacterium (ex Bugula neritina AB1)]|nr:hypothetical protein AB834_00555 [PVC group bacterium (ex Bugula neritina AB1)]